MIDVPPVTEVTTPPGLARHLAGRLGSWPPARPDALEITTSDWRQRPQWDGRIVRVTGMATPQGSVLSVPDEMLGAVTAAARVSADEAELEIQRQLGRTPKPMLRVVYRWLGPDEALPDLDDIGIWRPADAADVPEWLRPFGGESGGPVLVATVDGVHAAGVGIKHHDADVQEIAVVTDAAFRGRGLGVRLVVQAARAIHDRGAVATYLHLATNTGSAALAERAGFVERDWFLLDPG